MGNSVKRLTVPVVSVVMLVGVLMFPAAAVAVPSITSPAANPSNIQLNTRTQVLVTATVTNTNEIFAYGAINLEQLNADGSVTVLGRLVDDGSRGDKVAGDHVFSVLQNFTVKQTGTVRLRIAGNLVLTSGPKGGSQQIQSDVFELFVGTTVSGATGGTVPGTGGTTLTIPPVAGDGTWAAAIDALPTTAIVAPFNLQGAIPQDLVAAVEITFAPLGPADDVPARAAPLQISVPLPAGVTDTKFLVAEQVMAPFLGIAGVTPRLRAVALAAVVGTNIVTQPSPLPGILHSGIYALVTARGSGTVSGVVSDGAGVAVGGAIVASTTNAAIQATNGAGQYSLFVSGGPFTVTGFDAFHGTFGSTAGTIVNDGSNVIANIALAPLDTQSVFDAAGQPFNVPHIDGIRNSGFENCTLPAAADPMTAGGLKGTWAFTGFARAVTHLTTVSGVTILPTEGSCMLDISSGVGTQNQFSKAGQKFTVPAGARTLRFDFTFISEEFPEFIQTRFDDIFTARITTPSGDSQVAKVEVNDFPTGPPVGYTLIGDCFPNALFEGDDTCGQIIGDPGNPAGWRTATVDLSNVATVGTPVNVDLVFTVSDAGDNIYDTHVLIDNIRFGTVWVDAKVLAGATSSAVRLANDIRSANDVLSQAGLIVRARNNGQLTAIQDPLPGTTTTVADILDTDVSYAEIVPANCTTNTNGAQLDATPQDDETQLTRLFRGLSSDINAYYARNAIRRFPDTKHLIGYTVGPDEFCNHITIADSSGIILFDESALDIHAGVFPHEMGHLLIAPDNARDSVNEHGTTDSRNFMWGTNTPVNGVMTREQSFHINRPTNYTNAVNVLILP